MTKVFISYRRKESADFSGRLFDRLSGFYGSERVYMDVDDLIAGRDYREQIGEIIDDCSVVLAIIGNEWLEVADDEGKRRLDAPEDQLRIEIETAFEKNKTVVPVLVHGAKLPGVAELPESIRRLATLSPARIQSGVSFQGDVGKLFDRLEGQGVKHPDKRFPLEMILIPLGIICTCFGVFNIGLLPSISTYVNADIPAANQSFFGGPSTAPEPAPYFSLLLEWAVYSMLPLFLGPIFIVAGKRWCCLTKKAQASRIHFRRGGGRLKTPKNSKAVYSLASGLTFATAGALCIIPAVMFAIWALVELRRQKTWVQGRALAATGVVLSLLGILTTWLVHVPLWEESRWYKLYSEASAARASGDLESALTLYTQAEELESTSYYLFYATRLFRAETLVEANRVEEAKQVFLELVDESPAAQIGEFHIFEQVIEDLVVLYESEGDFDSAADIRLLKSSIGRESSQTDGYGGESQDLMPPQPYEPPPAAEGNDPSAPIPPPPVVDPSA